jgi:hypothetical protein
MVIGSPKTSKLEENAALPQHGVNGLAAQSRIGGGGAIEPLQAGPRTDHHGRLNEILSGRGSFLTFTGLFSALGNTVTAFSIYRASLPSLAPVHSHSAHAQLWVVAATDAPPFPATVVRRRTSRVFRRARPRQPGACLCLVRG